MSKDTGEVKGGFQNENIRIGKTLICLLLSAAESPIIKFINLFSKGKDRK